MPADLRNLAHATSFLSALENLTDATRVMSHRERMGGV